MNGNYTAASEYLSMRISTWEREISQPIKNTDIENNSKTISSLEILKQKTKIVLL